MQRSIIPVVVTRQYRSDNAGQGGFGPGTFFGYDWFVVDTGSMLELILPGNYQTQFAVQPDGTFIDTLDPLFTGAVFTKNGDGTYTLTTGGQWKYSFDTNKLLIGITDPNNNTLTLLRQNDTDVTSAVTPEGQTVGFTVHLLGRDRYTQITAPDGSVHYVRVCRQL